MNWDNRITRYEVIPTATVAQSFNSLNARLHSLAQQDTVLNLIEKIGYIQPIIINQNTNRLIDGHLRLALALREGQKEISAIWVNLTPAEEKAALLTLDATSRQATYSANQLELLVNDLALAARDEYLNLTGEDVPDSLTTLETINFAIGLEDSVTNLIDQITKEATGTIVNIDLTKADITENEDGSRYLTIEPASGTGGRGATPKEDYEQEVQEWKEGYKDWLKNNATETRFNEGDVWLELETQCLIVNGESTRTNLIKIAELLNTNKLFCAKITFEPNTQTFYELDFEKHKVIGNLLKKG